MEHYVFPTPSTHVISTHCGKFLFQEYLKLKNHLNTRYVQYLQLHHQVSKSMDDKLTLSYYTSATSFAIFLYYNNPIIPKSTLKHIHVAAVICLFAQVLYRIFFLYHIY